MSSQSRYLSFAFILLGFASHVYGLQAGSEGQEVLEVLKVQEAAWNRGDLEAFMRTYWHSEELTFFSGGNQLPGWKATKRRYEERYRSDGEDMGKLDFSELKVELLGTDSAFVRGRWRLRRTGQQVLSGLFTLILRRLEGEWVIVHDHTSIAD